MKMIINGLRIIAGGVIFAAVLTLLLSLPGLVSDRDSTVPISLPQAPRR